MRRPPFSFSIYHLAFVIAIVIRLALIPNPGFEADISFWKSWGLATYDKGIVEGMKATNNNYPTPFAYSLGAMVGIYSLFSDPHIFNDFWNNSNLLFLTISKLFPILADIGIAAIILYIGKSASWRTIKLGFPSVSLRFFGLSFYELLSIFYLLSPISIIDGAVWGQVDSVGLFIFLLSVLTLLKRFPFIAGVFYMLSMMTKLQNMIYAPLFFLFAFQYGGFKFLVQTIAGALTSFIGLNIEFILTRNSDRIFASLTENYDYFPWMSLNAYNLWWIVTGAKGMVTSDKLSVIGMVNAKTVGLLIFSGFYLFATLRQVFTSTIQMNQQRGKLGQFGALRRRGLSANEGSQDTRNWTSDLSAAALKVFLEGLVIVNAAFFFFQTQSHDRYAFPLSVFLLLWAPFTVYPTRHRRFFLFTIYYLLFTTFYFYNLHTALIINYPNNGIPFLSLLTQPIFTITTSFVLLGLFSVFIFTIIKSSLLNLYSLIFILIAITGGLFFLNLPLFTKQPVSLTKLTPFISEQAYGTRQTDKTVQSSFGGPNKWTRLSVQYAFYKKGIGSHANSKYTYSVNKNFSRFETDYGIDTESGTKASAIFEIYGDDTLLFRSEKMGRFDLPRHASVNIAGIKNLTLKTNDAGDENYDDHTDWLNPKLFP